MLLITTVYTSEHKHGAGRKSLEKKHAGTDLKPAKNKIQHAYWPLMTCTVHKAILGLILLLSEDAFI